ncbi:ferrous iron transport protein A [Sporobacter termitidis DSM 10068]|uniref:Ferrous iron transport protein A n=1 Tax=Sporobacter termitidis DSM 10068 TaxID=1123282 RepID=A0A1M5XID9_9FIRM|nr:FeoA family protein [Sporobacter termitidis]SHH99318.1 ferrous iron transport protein A [Sporobacter termitidis DSM 10068]
MAMNYAVSHAGLRSEACDAPAEFSRSPVPLSFVNAGDVVHIKTIRGKDETRRFLANMGFVDDAEVSVISEQSGNVIVSVKGTRIAISKTLASRVLTV